MSFIIFLIGCAVGWLGGWTARAEEELPHNRQPWDRR
jgi:hypothetical protein